MQTGASLPVLSDQSDRFELSVCGRVSGAKRRRKSQTKACEESDAAGGHARREGISANSMMEES